MRGIQLLLIAGLLASAAVPAHGQRVVTGTVRGEPDGKPVAEAHEVAQVPYHIACSATTRSEIVVPVLDRWGELRAVLDIDSDTPAAFDTTDQMELEIICSCLGTVSPVPHEGRTP